MTELKNGISLYGGSAAEADWYEKPGRVVAIFAGKKCLWKSPNYETSVNQKTEDNNDVQDADICR